MSRVAALYVASEGVYPGLEGVDAWDVGRDARRYRGPFPVVAHPPCAGWGRYRLIRHNLQDEWSPDRFILDANEFSCAPVAVWQVRQYGGVLEHPSSSALWDYAGLPYPGRSDRFGGVCVEVDQGCFGHPCRKRTWLYVVGYPERLPFARGLECSAEGEVVRQWSDQRDLTPEPFARLLLGIASKCAPGRGLVEALLWDLEVSND